MNQITRLFESWDRLRLYKPNIDNGPTLYLNLLKYVTQTHGWKVAAVKQATPGELAKLIQCDVEACESQIDFDATAIVPAKPLREQRGKRMTIDQRMKLVLFEKPESSGWSVTQFEAELKCSRAGIHKTASWKALEAARKLGKAERRKDRRAKTRSP